MIQGFWTLLICGLFWRIISYCGWLWLNFYGWLWMIMAYGGWLWMIIMDIAVVNMEIGWKLLGKWSQPHCGASLEVEFTQIDGNDMQWPYYPKNKYGSGWWFGTFFIVPYIGNFIIPIDFHVFQRGGLTTKQGWICSGYSDETMEHSSARAKTPWMGSNTSSPRKKYCQVNTECQPWINVNPKRLFNWGGSISVAYSITIWRNHHNSSTSLLIRGWHSSGIHAVNNTSKSNDHEDSGGHK